MAKKVRLHIRLESSRNQPREWVFDNPTNVTVGYLPSASIWLEDAAAGPARIVFYRKRGEIRFRFASDLTGRICVGQQEISLVDLREAGLLRKDSRGEYVILGKRTTGSISLGEHLFRFWVADAPKEPEYPTEFRPVVLLKNIQPVVTTTLVLSFILHFFLVKALMMLPPPSGPDLQEVQERYTRFTVNQVNYARKHLKKRVSETPPEISRPKRKPLPPQTAGGFLAAVATSKTKTKSPFSRIFTANTLGKSLTEALKGRSLEEAVTQELGRSRPARSDLGEAHAPARIGSLRQGDLAHGPIQVKISGPRVVTLSSEPSQIEGTLDQRALERLVTENSGQLRTCYERSLELNPKLSGKVVISLVVQMNGKPTTIRITDSSIPDPLLRQCLVARVSGWLFPRPVGAPTSIRVPLIFSAASRG